MSRLYPHSVTIWRKAGEDASRRAVWRRRTLDGVRWSDRRSRSGDAAADEAELLIPAVFSGYVPAEDVSAGRELGGAQWTLARGCRVALGSSLASAPPDRALSIESCETIRRGRRISHFEVTAR